MTPGNLKMHGTTPHPHSKSHEERLAVIETTVQNNEVEIEKLRDFKHQYAQYPNLTEHFIKQVNGFTELVGTIVRTNAEMQRSAMEEQRAVAISITELKSSVTNLDTSIKEGKDRGRWGIETVVSIGALIVAIVSIWMKGV